MDTARRWGLRHLGWAILWIAVGFGSGRLTAFTVHRLKGPPERKDPLAGWSLQRDRLERELEEARAGGSGEAVEEAVAKLVTWDPIHQEAHTYLSARRRAARRPGGPVAPAHVEALRPVEEELASRFGELAGDVLLHVRQGRTLQAAEKLRKRGNATLPGELVRIETLLREAGSLLLGRRVEAAHRKWQEAASVEEGLFGAIRSVPVREMGVSLAERWNGAAEQSLARGQLREAAAAWRHSGEAHPAQTEAAAGVRRVEGLARKMLAERPRCVELEEVLAATQPGSDVYREAEARAAQTCRKQGPGLSVIPPW